MKRCFYFLILLTLVSCGGAIEPVPDDIPSDELVSTADIVSILSSVHLSGEHLSEVHNAVSESVGNGYDSEYTMSSLFASPGGGVGRDKLRDDVKSSPAMAYSSPLRDVFASYFSSHATKDGGLSAEEYLRYVENSDIQIYWPYAEQWDGTTSPVITFDPMDGSETNVGYYMDDDGAVKEMTVSEETALSRPVWVINNNDDARHTTIDVLRKNNPEWGGGGAVVVGPTKASTSVRSLILKSVMLTRPYDSWFKGASELFIKIGAVESFNVTKESDIYLYNPSVTDFMVVVRRGQVNTPVELNTLLVSDWTTQLENCAFMIIEDDGGTITSWNCNAVVKWNSRSYGFEMSIPYRSRDDIVWRGQLSRKYIEATQGSTGNFGDAQLTFSIVQQ